MKDSLEILFLAFIIIAIFVAIGFGLYKLSTWADNISANNLAGICLDIDRPRRIDISKNVCQEWDGQNWILVYGTQEWRYNELGEETNGR